MDTNKVGVIAHAEDANPLLMLADAATIAEWNNHKLPSDKVSTQNGCILANSERWSLIIDPQLQGITWLKDQYKDAGLKTCRLTDKKYKDDLFKAVEAGTPFLIENLQEAIDATIQPVITRQKIKRGGGAVMKVGERELN
jgi:dynein heavy chain